jgi:DNA polymerase-3 subunit alpha
MARAEELGHTVIGFTDHESVSSWIKIEKEAKKHPNLKVIRGNEIYLVRNGLNSDNFVSGVDRYYHFILLAKDLIGAKQIMEISTRAWRRSYMARGMRRVPTYYQDLWDIIGANPGHVIGSTACLGGALPTQILRGTDRDKLDKWINQMILIFGQDDFYLEMQPSHNKDQIKVNRELFRFANYHGLNYIITTDSHYLKKEDRVIHKAYLNAQNGDREVDDFYATTYMMGTEELESYMKESFDDIDIIHAAYKSIEDIANKCEYFSLLKPLRIPDLKWKSWSRNLADLDKYIAVIPALAKFNESGYVSDNTLVWAIISGINEHPDLQNQQAYDEINSNLEMTWVSSEVNKARWSAYYLNLQKIIDLCWEAGSIVGPGRGSGVGFILLYVLGITQINPLREKTRTFPWRFLNPDRVSVLDIDFDIEGGRRAQVLSKFREYYGDDRVANVATFRTEKSKSAILTAARGLGIDVDVAQYIASLIPADRGLLRTLDQCMYGDEENDWAPIKQFVFEMTENYPELWNVAHNIEGLICGSGIHAGGVIFVDEPFTESTGLMRAPDGTICTAFELHDCEAASLIKYDALSVEAMDKIHICLDLLCEQGYIEAEPTLKETYEKVLGIYQLERDDPAMWKMVWNHEINSLFQMEQQSGIQGIAMLHPTSVDDLATLNSVIRLMAQEKGGEVPTEKLARFKADPALWDEEMDKWGLSEDEKKLLHAELDTSYGICESQEGFMKLVQLPECGGFNLTWADRLRKSIAKKNPKEFDQLTEEYYQNMKDKGLSPNLCRYVWKVLVAYSRGYGFNKSHTLAYSLIALQEMNLAFKYPIICWNCACLISDAGGSESEEEDEEAEEENKVEEVYSNEMEEFNEEEDEEEDSYEEEDCDGYPADVIKTKDGKKKKKVKATNYGKIATAIGKIAATGVRIAPPDINRSTYTFSPDIEGNSIRYGLSGITRIGEELIRTIITNRPYTSLADFVQKVKVNKPQMINLIKSGAFDSFGDRVDIMYQYVQSISGAKTRVTLQNMKMLIDFGLIPDEYDLQRRVFNFNKYIKKLKLDNQFYGLDRIAMKFFEQNFSIDSLVPDSDTESGFKIKQIIWDNIYQKQMDIIRPFAKKNATDLLAKMNYRLMHDVWNKYCQGSISKWEMDSISCYIHDHELSGVDGAPHKIEEFYDLSETPEVDRFIFIKGKQIPLLRLHRIMGTVLDRNKAKKTVTLLTTEGVVTVKIYGGVFAQYDKQISERGADGKKHVIRKSEFSRGNKIIIIGVRDGANEFRAKKYSKTPYHLIETIKEVVGSDIVIDNRNDGDEE